MFDQPHFENVPRELSLPFERRMGDDSVERDFFFLILIPAVIVTSHLPDGGKPQSRKQQQAGDRITH